MLKTLSVVIKNVCIQKKFLNIFCIFQVFFHYVFTFWELLIFSKILIFQDFFQNARQIQEGGEKSHLAYKSESVKWINTKEKSGFCDEVAPMKTAPLCSQGPVKRKAGNGLYHNGL